MIKCLVKKYKDWMLKRSLKRLIIHAEKVKQSMIVLSFIHEDEEIEDFVDRVIRDRTKNEESKPLTRRA